jgi:hypothetical protein
VDYQLRLLEHLVRYKHTVLGIIEPGTFRYRGRDIPKAHVLPIEHTWANLLEPAQSLVEDYLRLNPRVRLHRYFHQLNSSQAFAFNLFFPFLSGDALASAALLRAFGQEESLDSWEPESVPDDDEGTNLDARWVISDGTGPLYLAE